jgi:hypothetical protein
MQNAHLRLGLLEYAFGVEEERGMSMSKHMDAGVTCPLDPHIRKYDFGFEGGY